MTEEMQIQRVLEEKVRPALQAHGGDFRFAGYQDHVVSIELTGACAGCPSADLGTKSFVQETLQRELPFVRAVALEQSVDEELLEFARSRLRRLAES